MRAAYAVQGVGFLLLATVIGYLLVAHTERVEEEQAVLQNSHNDTVITSDNDMPMLELSLSSPAFVDGELMPSKYTCDGDNHSPPLAIEGVPEAAVSLVLIMDDPDVPQNIREDGMWDHWIVFNIPPETSRVGEGEEPRGVHGVGTGGNSDYRGPCPPDKEHRYFFKLYVLDTTLDLPEGATKTEVEGAIEGHVLVETSLMGRYEREE